MLFRVRAWENFQISPKKRLKVLLIVIGFGSSVEEPFPFLPALQKFLGALVTQALSSARHHQEQVKCSNEKAPKL